MPRVAIEFCDPGLALVRRRDAPLESPGVALLGEGEALKLGGEAFARSRLAPRSVQNRFWDRLGLDRLPAPAGGVETVADLAAAHLAALWRSGTADSGESEEAILVVPGSFEREQLGVLLGVAQRCGIPVGGMVDAAVAASVTLPEGLDADRQILHVDVLLHRTVLTAIEREDGLFARGEVRSHRQLGIASLRDLWAKFVADLFVRGTRFDPLHRAESEQALYDRLPGALAALSHAARVPLEIEAGDTHHQVVLDRGQLAKVASAQYERLERAIEAGRQPGRGLDLLLSSRAAGLPGLVQSLKRSSRCEVVTLGAGAAGFGALERAEEICAGEGVALVTTLRHVDEAPATRDAGPRIRESLPSHVLHGDRAYALGPKPVCFVADPVAGRGLRLAAAGDAASEVALLLVATEAGVRAELQGDAQLLVNGRTLETPATLRLGDTLELGEQGEALRLIRVAGADGP